MLANLICELAGTGKSDVSSQTAVKTLAQGITTFSCYFYRTTMQYLFLYNSYKTLSARGHPFGWEPDCESCHDSASLKVTSTDSSGKPLLVVQEKCKTFNVGLAFGASILQGSGASIWPETKLQELPCFYIMQGHLYQ